MLARRGCRWRSDPREAFELQEVEGVGVPEHDGFDLFGSSHQQSLQAAIAHVGMGPLGSEATFVDGLALLTGHAPAPSDGAGFVTSARGSWITLALLGQGTEQLDPLGMQGFDVGLAVVASVGERAPRLDAVSPPDLSDCRFKSP